MNVISNALEHGTKEGGDVRVGARDGGGEVIYYVTRS